MNSIQKIKQKYREQIDLLDLELIISRVIKKPREFVIIHPEHKIIKNYGLRITDYIKRRINGEPIAYIFGEKEFYGLNFKVNKNTLVPRPETELLIELAIEYIRNPKSEIRNPIIIDVGTGSGCIIITLAKILNSKCQIPNSKFIATDISVPALRTARQNAKLHKVDKKIKFLQGNLLEPIINSTSCKLKDTSYIILANLPYLAPSQIKNSPSIQREPKLALSAGQDGLKYYRLLFKQIKKINILHIAGCVLCEIDPSQTAEIKKIIKNNLPTAKIKIKKDLSGLNRLAVITI